MAISPVVSAKSGRPAAGDALSRIPGNHAEFECYIRDDAPTLRGTKGAAQAQPLGTYCILMAR